jgi:hypothetical protein
MENALPEATMFTTIPLALSQAARKAPHKQFTERDLLPLGTACRLLRIAESGPCVWTEVRSDALDNPFGLAEGAMVPEYGGSGALFDHFTSALTMIADARHRVALQEQCATPWIDKSCAANRRSRLLRSVARLGAESSQRRFRKSFHCRAMRVENGPRCAFDQSAPHTID